MDVVPAVLAVEQRGVAQLHPADVALSGVSQHLRAPGFQIRRDEVQHGVTDRLITGGGRHRVVEILDGEGFIQQDDVVGQVAQQIGRVRQRVAARDRIGVR